MLDALERARLAARDLLHLQPRRAASARWRRCWPRASRCSAARAAPAGGRGDPRGGGGDARPSRSRRSTRPSSRRCGMGVGMHHAGILPSVKRLIELALRARPLPGGLRHRDHVARHPHAGEERGAAVAHQADGPRLPQPHPQRADPDGGPGGPPRHRSRGQVRDRARRARRRSTDMRRVVDGSPEPIVSQFKLGYGSVALLLGSGSDMAAIRRIGRVLVRPVPEPQAHPGRSRRRWRSLETAVADGARAFTRPAATSPASAATVGSAPRWRRARRPRGRGGRRGRAYGGGRGARAPRARAAPRRPGLGLLCRVDARGATGAHPACCCPTASIVQLKAGHVKRVFWADAAPARPARLGAPHPRRSREQLARADGAGAPRARAEPRAPRGRSPPIECHRCPWDSQPRCEHAWKGLEKLERQLAQKRETLDAFRNAYWQEFLRVVEVLERFGAVQDGKLLRQGPAHRRAPTRQRAAGGRGGRPRHPRRHHARRGGRALLVAHRGVALGRRGGGAALPPQAAQAQAQAPARWSRSPTRCSRRSGAAGCRCRSSVSTGFMPAVFRWASGEDDWAAIVEESFGGHEGDLIRAMRRLIDVLRQLAECAGGRAGAGRRSWPRASRVIDRGIVLESALI